MFTQRLRAGICLSMLAGLLAGSAAHAQVGPAPAPLAPPVPEPVPGGIPAPAGVPQSLRWTEDWTIAATPRYRAANPLERLRYIPLGRPDIYLSVGGEVREYYQSWTHQALGGSADDRNRNLGQRLRLIADLHLTPYLRVFSELGNNSEYGALVRTPPNRDHVEFQQIFADVTIPLGKRRWSPSAPAVSKCRWAMASWRACAMAPMCASPIRACAAPLS
ncbi:alginate export family protein [Novosphingobium rosa]|uniref:alginate export family protein n=1 Tax=Novosphingobium rosa TaxID=76978 RepID=UPI000835F79E|nr:alginate export family protein [Novosphingobium rosa]